MDIQTITNIPEPINTVEIGNEENQPQNGQQGDCTNNFCYEDYQQYPVEYNEYYEAPIIRNQNLRIEKNPVLLPSIKEAFTNSSLITNSDNTEKIKLIQEKKPKKSKIESSRNKNKQYLRELSEQSLQFSTRQSESNECTSENQNKEISAIEDTEKKSNDTTKESTMKYGTLRNWLNKNALYKRKQIENKEKESVENTVNKSTNTSFVEQSPQQQFKSSTTEKSKSEQIKIQIPRKENCIRKDELTKKIIELRDMVVSDLHMIYSKSNNETERMALWRLITDINNLRYGQPIIINQKNRGCYTQTVREIDKKMDLILNLLKDYHN